MINLLNELFNGYIQFIDIYSNHKPPPKPFATYQVLFTNPNGVDIIERASSESNVYMITEKITKYFEDTVQIDIYGSSLAECFDKYKYLSSKLLYRYREIITNRGLGLVNITQAKPITSTGVSNTEFRINFNIIYSYSEIYTYDVENTNAVTYAEEEWS